MTALRRTMSVGVGLALAIALNGGVSLAGGPDLKVPEDVFVQGPGDDAVDVLLIGGAHAAVVRVHVKIDGKPYKTAWGDLVLRLHAYLDRNDDGVLTTDEANRAPWTNLLQPLLNGNSPIRPGMRPTAMDSNPRDGKVSFDELVSYIKGSQSYEPVASQSGEPADPRLEAVFQQFDHNGDKSLVPAELAATDRLIARLDRDEDETISLDEFAPDQSPLANRFGRVNAEGVPIDIEKSLSLLLSTPEQIASAAARLLRTYGEPRGKHVRAEPLGADPQSFAAADADGNGTLDLNELKHYLTAPTAHLELVVTLSATTGTQGRIEKALPREGSTQPKVLQTREPQKGSLLVDYAGTEIEFRADEFRNNVDSFLVQQFTMADGDQNGAISASEARGNFYLARIFPVADRNGDGQMTSSEMKAYLALNTAALDARLRLTVSDRGIAIYETLDADRDNRLSIRELRRASADLASFDLDRDGRIALGELPRRSQLNFGRGSLRIRNFRVVGQILNRDRRPRAAGLPTPPTWFLGMDRNHDGDVSPREFLGKPEQFRRFDTDGDGLIDAKEATITPGSRETAFRPAG